MMDRDRIAAGCRRICAGGSFMFVCYFGGSTGQDVRAQEPIPRISAAQKMVAPPMHVFSVDLEILSKRLGVAFVAEGEPVPVTRAGPVPSLSEALSQEDAVYEVAEYFDYSFTRQGNVYLLTKRYTSPEDQPDVSPEECKSCLKTITGILAPFNPKIPPGTFAGEPMAKIVHMLSAEQLDKIGKSGLPVSELTPSQHEEVWKLALRFYVQNAANDIEENYNALENRNPADPVFHWQTIKNIVAFGYNTRSVELTLVSGKFM